jgi:hypothetical protein
MSPSALDRRSGFLAFFLGGTRVAIGATLAPRDMNVIEGSAKGGSARVYPAATRGGRGGRGARGGWRRRGSDAGGCRHGWEGKRSTVSTRNA